MHKFLTMNPNDLKFGRCLPNCMSECSAKLGAVWTKNTKDIEGHVAVCGSIRCSHSPSHTHSGVLCLITHHVLGANTPLPFKEFTMSHFNNTYKLFPFHTTAAYEVVVH